MAKLKIGSTIVDKLIATEEYVDNSILTISLTPGPTGNPGTNAYTYIRYSANSNGSGMVTTPTSSTLYIGIYTGTSDTVPAYTAFTWSKYVGDTGAKGDTGANGQNGYTPIRGTDYWTSADQTAIINSVLAALPNGDGVDY